MNIKLLTIGTLCAVIALSSCKKNDTEAIDSSEEMFQKASDEANVESYSNQMMEDLNVAFDDYSTANKGVQRRTLCGASIDTSQKSSGRITITFDSTSNCRGRIRSGKIVLERIKEVEWKTAGAIRKATFINVKITSIVNNKSLTINGVKTITNLSGGRVIDLTNGGSVEHKIRGSMNITFDNGAVRSWNVAKNRKIELNNNVTTFKLRGDTSFSDATNILFWGKNRNDEEFITYTPETIESNSSCEFDEPIKGVIDHQKLSKNFKITFGVNADGERVSSGCAYGYKVETTNRRGQAVQRVIEYR